MLCRVVHELAEAHDTHITDLNLDEPKRTKTARAVTGAMLEVVVRNMPGLEDVIYPIEPALLVDTRLAYMGYASGLTALIGWQDPKDKDPDLWIHVGPPILDDILSGKQALDRAITEINLLDAAGTIDC